MTGAPTRLAGYLGKAIALDRGPAGVPVDDIKLSWGGTGATLSMITWQFGDLDFALFEGDQGVAVEPAVRHRTPWAGLIVGMCLGGDITLEQAGRSVALRDGHFTFFHGHAPYRISAGGAHRWLVCRLRFLRIGLDSHQVGGLLAGDMTTAGSAGRLLADLLRGCAGSRDTLRVSGKLHCADAIHSLVRAVIDEAAASVSGPRPATDPFGRYTQWLEERIQTPGLDAAQVATAHHVSIRHVRGVFAGNGVTVSSFVRDRRLEHLRHDLLDPSLTTYTVAGLARRWGLDNPAAANRLFRTQYGQPPATYRRQNSGT